MRTAAADGMLAVIVCGGLLATDTVAVGHLGGVQIAAAAGCAVALGLRRLRLSAALTLTVIALLAQFVELRQIRAIDLAGLPALYSSWAWGSRPTRGAAIIMTFGGSMLSAVSSPFELARDAAESSAVIGAATLLVSLTACGMGQLTRTQRALAQQLQLRVEHAEIEQRQVAELAAQRERARMARDVHDVVAHSLTVIAVQAQAGSFAVSDSRHDSGAAKSTLDCIADTAKDALIEVRGVLRLLRSNSYPPARSLIRQINLDSIVARARETGLKVATVEHGVARTTTEPVADAVQFLGREALTNCLRHAGTGAEVLIALTWTESALDITIENSAGRRPAWRTPGTGVGLVGMRERVAAVGGRIEYGPIANGFRIAATVPLT